MTLEDALTKLFYPLVHPVELNVRVRVILGGQSRKVGADPSVVHPPVTDENALRVDPVFLRNLSSQIKRDDSLFSFT